MSTNEQRETLADAIGQLHDACGSDGLVYAEEMTMLVAAWFGQRHRMGRHGPVQIDTPEPDDDEHRSPGHRLFELVGCPPVDRAPTSTDRPRRSWIRRDGLVAQLREVLDGSRPSLRVGLDDVNLGTLATYCVKTGRNNPDYRLSLAKRDKRTFIVTRKARA